MDAGSFNPTKRRYPAYTTDQLMDAIRKGVTEYCDADKIADMQWEVTRRKAGISKTMHEILNGNQESHDRASDTDGDGNYIG